MGAKTKKCPKCGQKNTVVPIMYGMPSGEAMEEAERGDLMLAGCMVGDVDPQLNCRACAINFAFARPELAAGVAAQRGWIDPQEGDEASSSGQ
ncbi:MAG: hypothetical protein WED85_07850 [Dehalococcoidia bacterium]